MIMTSGVVYFLTHAHKLSPRASMDLAEHLHGFAHNPGALSFACPWSTMVNGRQHAEVLPQDTITFKANTLGEWGELMKEHFMVGVNLQIAGAMAERSKIYDVSGNIKDCSSRNSMEPIDGLTEIPRFTIQSEKKTVIEGRMFSNFKINYRCEEIEVPQLQLTQLTLVTEGEVFINNMETIVNGCFFQKGVLPQVAGALSSCHPPRGHVNE